VRDEDECRSGRAYGAERLAQRERTGVIEVEPGRTAEIDLSLPVEDDR